MALRSPQLYESLKRYCLGAFAYLYRESQSEAPLQFSFEEHATPGRPALYDYHPLARGYVEARAEELAVGVERAAAFLQTASRSAGGLGRVYTIGGGARIPGLNEALSARLRVPVEMASPVQRLKVRDSVFESVAVDEVAPLLMLSVGLALRRAA